MKLLKDIEGIHLFCRFGRSSEEFFLISCRADFRNIQRLYAKGYGHSWSWIRNIRGKKIKKHIYYVVGYLVNCYGSVPHPCLILPRSRNAFQLEARESRYTIELRLGTVSRLMAVYKFW